MLFRNRKIKINENHSLLLLTPPFFVPLLFFDSISLRYLFVSTFVSLGFSSLILCTNSFKVRTKKQQKKNYDEYYNNVFKCEGWNIFSTIYIYYIIININKLYTKNYRKKNIQIRFLSRYYNAYTNYNVLLLLLLLLDEDSQKNLNKEK